MQTHHEFHYMPFPFDMTMAVGQLVAFKKFFFGYNSKSGNPSSNRPVDQDRSNTPHSALKLKAQSDGSLCRMHFFYFIFNNSLPRTRSHSSRQKCPGSLPLSSLFYFIFFADFSDCIAKHYLNCLLVIAN